MTFQIERLELEELIAFLHFQAEDSFPSMKDENRLKMLAEKWSSNADCSTCRDNEGKLVGMIAFYANGQGADFAYIPHVYVLPMYRRKGIFSNMLENVVRYIKEKGFHEIRLEVGKLNNRAQQSYQCNGFDVMPSNNSDVLSFYMSKKV
jgi:ribosomal protein S18 acetylase RimI-like enzyme